MWYENYKTIISSTYSEEKENHKRALFNESSRIHVDNAVIYKVSLNGRGKGSPLGRQKIHK